MSLIPFPSDPNCPFTRPFRHIILSIWGVEGLEVRNGDGGRGTGQHKEKNEAMNEANTNKRKRTHLSTPSCSQLPDIAHKGCLSRKPTMDPLWTRTGAGAQLANWPW